MAGEVMDILFRARMNVSDVATGIGQIQRDLKKLELPKDITDNLEKGFNKVTPLIKEYQKILSKETKTPKDIKNLETLKAKIHEVMGDIKVDLNQINSTKIQPKADLSELKNINKEINSLEKQLSGKMSSLFKGKGISAESAQGIIDKMGRVTSLKGLVTDVQLKFNQQDIQGYTKAVDALENKIKSIKTESTKIDIAKALGAKKGDLADLDNFFTNVFKNMRLDPTTVQKVAELRNNLRELEQTKTDKTFDSFENGKQAINDVINAFSQLSDKSEQAGADVSKAGQSIMSMTEQVGQLQQSTQYFFSLRNMINLLKRGIDDAVQSVKELDAAMTETAVVTNYKVSDLWGMLPQYTQLANQLGATTQGAYETMTLYFQQGLDQQAAFEIGAETMKMARIAGLDYAETTDMMTAALRGFNMELNETSAKRVNDVYSELAAITASDTEELGTAMQRTASIAHSAGASFEGTTAFLAQAIETTREPAENIGTAMKTIVARFQEMKKNPLEISEVDGEEVDYNKIDAALKTIGVDLKDTNGQFRDFDQVMLDISARWDSLSQSQQRYIATVAAGSRQQSRFIAMVSNYDRTMQLMEAANNSTGASDEQFGKTMDSLEAKLNKLHNAWQAFTMGIANNSMIKLAVDGLTGFLTVTNKIIDTLSLGSGAIKSFLSVFAAFTGLKIAGRTANSLIGGLGGLVDPQSTVKEGLKIGLFGQGKANAQAQAITNPIVGSLNRISQQIAQIKNNGINNKKQSGSEIKNTSKQDYLNIKAQFDKLSSKEGFKISDASSLFSQLDAKHQLSMFNNSPGTRAAMKKASMTWFDSKGLSKELNNEGKQYINAIYKGMQEGQIPVDKGVDLIGQPLKWGAYFGTDLAKSYTQAFVKETLSPSTQAAHEAAMNFLGFNSQNYKVGSKELKDLLKNDKQLATDYASLYSNFRGKLDKQQDHGQAEGKVSNLGRFANDIGAIGDKFTQAGYGIQSFGNALSQLGGPIGIVGTGISTLGGAISSMGMMVSGATSLITVFSEGIQIAGTGIAISGAAIAAVAAPLAAVAAGILLFRHHVKKVKEAGEEITKTFSDINKETTDSIGKLKSYKGEFAALSQGVDVNGNNVNLDDSQYQRYLEIVDDIAKINPAIVKGYNAQGHAILDNNTALEETLRLEQQRQKEAYQTYLRTDSLQKLINARNVNSDYGKAVNNLNGTQIARKASPLMNDVQSLAERLSLSVDRKSTEYILEKYGIESLDALKRGEDQAVRDFVKHQDQIQADLSNLGLDLSKEVLEGFQTLGDNTKAFDEAIKPVYDNLLALVSNSSAYKDLAPEIQSALAEGLKGIASQNLNASEMQQAASYLMLEFQTAFDNAQPYLEDADKALESFTQNLDEAAYNNKASEIADNLRELANQAEAVGQVEIAEWYENQAARIEGAITNATYSIADGIDTLADNITKAKSNFDSLAEGIDDYYTLTDKARGLVDTALEDKNAGGNGSKTFWKTYQGLASEEAFNRHDIDEAVADMQQFQKFFAEGVDGAAAFGQELINAQDRAFTFTNNAGEETIAHVRDFFELADDGTMQITDNFKNLSDEQYSQLSAAFKLSDDGFTAILNNLRQWGDIEFDDPELIRKALAVDTRSVTTNKQVSVEGQENKVNRLYYGQSVLDAEMMDKSESEREDIVRDLEVQGSIRLPSGAENLIKAGIKTNKEGNEIKDGSLLKQFVNDTKGTGNQMQNVMSALIKSGEYNKEDLQKIHQSIVDQGLLSKAKDANKDFNDIYEAAALEVKDPATEAANERLSDISSTVTTIAGIIAAGKVREGYLPDVAKQSGALHDEIVGKKGVVDTWIQKFAHGKDEQGYAITNKALYNDIYAKLDQYKTANDNYINELKLGRAAAEERGASTAELQAFDEEIQAAEQNTKLLSDAATNAATSLDQIDTDFNLASQSVFEGLATIRNNSDLSESEQKTETATVLTDFANQLQSLNFSPEAIQSVFKENFGIELELKGGEFATDVGEQINQQISNKDYDINAILNIASIKMPGAARGKNNTPSAIRRVGTMARGSKKHGYTINGEPTLTGELGPELVWEPKQNAAYMVGENGPQFANLSKNAVVWNAEQTKRIKKNSKISNFGTGAKGIHRFGTMGLGSLFGGRGGGSTLPGVLNLDANATIQEVTPPAEEPTIPVKGELHFGDNKEGFLGKIFGGQQNEPMVAGTITVDNSEAIQKIEEVKTKTAEAKITIENGATFKVTVKDSGLKTAATRAATINRAAGNKQINVSAQTSGFEGVQSLTNAVKDFSKLKDHEVDLSVDVSGIGSISTAISYVREFYGLRNDTVTLTTIKETINRATGSHNHGYASSPSFNSAASGYGQLGPKGRGGLTLTGELGYEIAWIPSENRSMILGANGPQMLNLPGDAVVWTHEQSKKILKQQAIPAGSHGNTAKGKNILEYVPVATPKSTGNGNGGGGGGGGQDSDTTQQNADNAEEAKKVIKDAGWVTVWWENMTRRVDSTQKKIDNLSSKFDKQIKRFGTTVTSIQSTVKGYRNSLNQSISLNKAEIKQAKKELKFLDAGGNFYSRKEVSYEETEGDKKESKKMTVSLGNYIKYNKKYGTYEIDQNQIDQVGLRSWTDGNGKKHGGNKSLAEAIKQAAEKEINDRNSKIKTAEDNIKKAQEALEKVSNDVYETFYGWEKSINGVYLLGRKLESITQQLSVTNAKLDLQFNKIAAGATNAAGAQAKINEALTQQRNGLLNKANASKQNLSATKSEFQNSLSLQPYLRNYLKNPDSTAAKNDYIAAKKTFAFLDKVNLSGNNFNYTEALKYLNNAGMSKDEYDAIKSNLDKIFEKQSNYLQAQETAQQSISEIYQTMEEYQSFIADFEADLLTGMEEEAENQIQHLEKLNSSLTKALKDLLDEVKNRLDQRRKQEDNKKTESDLSQKQQRLTMLRADTGGGHAVEIAQLEKELAEAQQNYQRTLEDQLLERLQQQGDIAEKQRQHQIDLLSIQNQIAKETGTNLAQVREWMSNPEKYYEQIRAAWLENQHYDEVAPNEQKNLEEQFEQNFAKFRGYKEQLDKYDEMIGQLDTLENDVNRIATEVSLNKPKHTAADMKALGYSAGQLREGGYKASSLLNAGYTVKQLKKGGYSAKQVADALKERVTNKKETTQGAITKMRQAGYSADEITKYFGASSLLKAGYSGARIQKNQNLSAKVIQDRINKNIDNPNVSQEDMAGVKIKIDTNGKKKGGITEGTVTANGKWIYANVGSTLYGQQLDTKTGKGTGKVHHVTIDQLAEKHFTNNKKEATEALIYGIQHYWGQVLNKNFKSLAKIAGIVGKQYDVDPNGNHWGASIGADGIIYKNAANGVAKWDPATGKTWTEAYNKAHFLEVAKRNNGVSREYAQVLINKKAYTKKALQKLGVKQFRTGGLADYTGPAWLDGTPAKPELVLNAQDTKNFIALKDVLSKAIGSTSSVSNEYGGDATYEININVDHLNSDYDVDKVAERVKKIIVKDSSYRNVTQVRKFR